MIVLILVEINIEKKYLMIIKFKYNLINYHLNKKLFKFMRNN